MGPVIRDECKNSSACPDASRSCNRVYREELGIKKSASEIPEKYRAECIMEWYRTPETKADRTKFWKSKNIGRPHPISEADANAECCDEFACFMDENECPDLPVEPTPKPEPIVCNDPANAGDCLDERRKCFFELQAKGIAKEMMALDTDGNLNMANCVHDHVKKGTANDCCKSYVCEQKQSEGGLKGTEICDGDVPTADPTEPPTPAPVVTFWTYSDWNNFCKTSFDTQRMCKSNGCVYKNKKCSAGPTSQKFQCKIFGFVACDLIKGCIQQFSDDGKVACVGTVDVDSFLP